jgi:hypothetical protein
MNVFECIATQCQHAVVPDGGLADGGYLPCEETCFQGAKGNGGNEAEALLTQVRTDCLSPCRADTVDAGADGGSCVSAKPFSSVPACNTCIDAHPADCTDWNACSADVSCTNYIQCVTSCEKGVEPDGGTFDAGDVDGGLGPCTQTCSKNAPGNGVREFDALVAQLHTDCLSSCFQ